MKGPVDRAERIYFRIVAAILGGALAVALLAWGGVHVYHRWQERHLVRRAAGYLSGGDVKTASLNARRAYQLNPENAATARMLAQIAQRAGDGSELEWRRKVLELHGVSLDDQLALVRAALRANDLATADRTLQAVRETDRNTAAYHAALGRLAEIRKNTAEAEMHWAKAAELAPEETGYQTQLALVQLTSGDEGKRTAAREALERLRSDEKQRAAATRALIMDSTSRRTDPESVRRWTEELQSYPDALFGDRLLYAEVLRQLRDPGFTDYLRNLEQQAPLNAANLSSLLSWMTANGMATDAVSYASALPRDATAKWPVFAAVAEAYAKAEDWSGLQQAFEGADWGAFNFLRHAYLARAARATDDALAAEQEWSQAQKEASTQAQTLLLLAQTITGWDWQKEKIDLLWALTKMRETQRGALHDLYQHYANTGDTAGVYRVLLRSVEIAPEDQTLENNFAQISLLLEADPERARKIAADLAQKVPNNAAYVSTYAFSLQTSGDIQGALRVFRTLTDEQLRTPGIAAYYGIALAAAGDKDKAGEFLELGAKAFLLPEEKALLAKAQSPIR